MNFDDSAQYENSGRSREGAQVPHICGMLGPKAVL